MAYSLSDFFRQQHIASKGFYSPSYESIDWDKILTNPYGLTKTGYTEKGVQVTKRSGRSGRLAAIRARNVSESRTLGKLRKRAYKMGQKPRRV